MSDFVLDASTSLALYLPNTPEQEAYATKVFTLIATGAVPAIPHIWSIEVASVLIKAKRSGAISRTTLDRAMGFLDGFSAEIHHIDMRISYLVEIAHRYTLSGYDAVYFDMAKKMDIPLASLDKGHRSACKAHGVKLI